MKLTIGMIYVGLVLSFMPTASLAEIHKWKDANGAIHYGDQPTPGVNMKQTNVVQTNNTNQVKGCGNPVLTTQERRAVEREESIFWKKISPQEMAQLKRHPLWSHFLSTVEIVKLYRQYETVARGDFASKFYQENRNKTKDFFQNNPEIGNTLVRLQAAEACKDRLDDEIVPKMLRRLDNSPFEKYFLPPSTNRFEDHTPAPSPD